jgi:phage gp46-like protein
MPFAGDFTMSGLAEAKKLALDAYALESYKKLKSKDIVLTIEKGVVYVMVGRNRWDAAKNNLKLITGDKLKVVPGTIASINFYDEFDINLPESELTTIEPAGITQLINEALFRTTYKDGTYVSDVVYEPSKLAQYKFRGAIADRDLKLEYSKNRIEKKSNAVLIEEARRQREKNKVLRDRVMQAKNFGNGFTFNYENAEKKINNDNRIFSFEREKQMVEREIYSKMSAAAVLQKIIVSRKAAGVSAAAEEAQLNELNNQLRGYTQKLEYINVTLRAVNEEQNKLKLKPKTKEW